VPSPPRKAQAEAAVAHSQLSDLLCRLERRIEQGERLIIRRREILALRIRGGRDATKMLKVLCALEQIHELLIGQRDRIRAIQRARMH
jgi:hypothetical protein